MGKQAHKQTVKGTGKDVASSIPNPTLLGAGSSQERPTKDRLGCSHAMSQTAELEVTLVGPFLHLSSYHGLAS